MQGMVWCVHKGEGGGWEVLAWGAEGGLTLAQECCKAVCTVSRPRK